MRLASLFAGLSALLATGLAPAFAAGPAATTIPDRALATAETLRAQGLKDDLAWTLTEDLTTSIGPRLAGSANDLKAREWMAARFRALGFDTVRTEPVSYPKWVRRSESGAIVAPVAQTLALTALGNSGPTPKGGLTAEVAAFASLEALQAATDAAVRGKIVYVANPRMSVRVDGADYGKGSRVRSRGPSLAAQKGAAAFVLRSVGSDNNRTPHTGVTSFADGVTPIPAAALSNPDADLLDTVLRRSAPVSLRLDLDCGLEGEYTGANVIGEISGRDDAGEYVLTGGHLDSWDLGTGAIDDASGIAITTAAAHLIAQLPERPRRSIRVVAFANEEAGLYGGKAYAENHRAEIAKAVIGAESDAGADRIVKLTATVKPSARGAIDRIAAALAPLGVTYDAAAPGSGGSDLSAVHAVGMAGLSLHQDTSRYFEWHHTANDTLDKVDIEQLRQNVAVYAVALYLAAEAEGDFGSAPGAFAKDGAN
ncbi:M20/M25/M40 family metallo-hydrolase [Dokdonella koreensis]|uniref:Carboxypeptidase Q n=1 Tax=Dokdonella koreensis DS-123 TaxID=1300342 RepID=A0A167GQJ6_9GAMM|nr:M20/M25/M40 family metallo-hydrolase [Dokdonella koreensis]ANB17122.1 Peptidase M28 [Dokdonella koreensis DS-123]